MQRPGVAWRFERTCTFSLELELIERKARVDGAIL
jgi:hypothetical protein